MFTKQEYSVTIFDTTGMLTHFQTVRSGLEGAKLVSSIIGTVRRTVRNETKAGFGWKFADADRIVDRKSTRLNSSHVSESRMPSSA